MGECPTAGGHGTRACTREHLFCIRGWSAWTPGRETEASWREWAGAQSIAAPDGSLNDRPPTPANLRRRVSPLGQAALRAAWGLPGIGEARVILASRHGEFGRTLSILDALAASDGPSPADFTLSVHHALIGLLSIATNNRRGHTALAAGNETFGLGFVEAVTCLVERPAEPVALIYFDEGLPAPFDDFDDSREPPLALALALTRDGPSERFGLTRGAPSPDAPRQPAQALDFLRFLLTDLAQLSSPGADHAWLWRRHAAAA